MTTKLDGPLRREVEVAGVAYTLTITPEGLTLAEKGRRKGFDLAWEALVSGDAALAIALNASVKDAPPSRTRRVLMEPVTTSSGSTGEADPPTAGEPPPPSQASPKARTPLKRKKPAPAS